MPGISSLCDHPLQYHWFDLPWRLPSSQEEITRQASGLPHSSDVVQFTLSSAMFHLLRAVAEFWKATILIFDISLFFENLSRELKFHQNLTRISGTLHADRYTFLIISRWILLRTRNVSNKSCRENRNIHFVFSNFFFRKAFRLWDNIKKYSRTGQAIDDNVVHAHCKLDTNKHSEYVIIIGFPLQRWLHEGALSVRYTYSACLVSVRVDRSSTLRNVTAPW
jgi:hypothetical protein